jgi:hypothetical protein
MIDHLGKVLVEIEDLRRRMNEIYLQKHSIKNRNLLKISRKLDRKLNIHMKQMR